MDQLIDDWPLTVSGETTFEFVRHYMPILLVHYVNGRLTGDRKTEP